MLIGARLRIRRTSLADWYKKAGYGGWSRCASKAGGIYALWRRGGSGWRGAPWFLSGTALSKSAGQRAAGGSELHRPELVEGSKGRASHLNGSIELKLLAKLRLVYQILVTLIQRALVVPARIRLSRYRTAPKSASIALSTVAD